MKISTFNIKNNYDDYDKTKSKEISIYNTHLEARILKVKKKQLQKVYDIIKNDNRPIILMGDFNLTTNNKDFNIFIKKLELIGMNRIMLHEKTLKPSKNNLEIDHIFISKNFSLKSKEVIKDLEISDHYPVIAEISL